ncbi:site-specific integrase [Pseudomonas syringae pv. actinidiae]|nr:site-specific integrase [Pseudomonas syringae pv. actinidiae]
MANAVKGGALASQIIIELPIAVNPSFRDEALIDLKYAYIFITESSGNSEATFKAYRSAIERFLLFMWLKQERSLNEMHKRDFLAFLEFVQEPDPEWIGMHSRRFIEGFANPEWRPFAIKPPKGKTQDDKNLTYKCAESTVKSVMSRLSSFFTYLVQEERIASNPSVQIRNKRQYIKKQGKLPVKRLTNRQMEYCKLEADLMASAIPEMHERTRFIMFFMLSLYLRISELVPGPRHTPMMKDFVRDADGYWWFNVVGGKGNKDRLVPMSDDDIAVLARYRVSRNLHPYPSFNDEEPLIHKIRGTGSVTSDRQIRKVVQSCFDSAKRRLMDDGHVQDAHTLYEATVHWLRHTGISEDLNANDRPLAHVAEDAGHSDIKTTSLYIDSDLHDRHNSKQKGARQHK